MIDDLSPPRIKQLVAVRVSVEQRPRTGEQHGGERRQAVLLIEHGCEVADIEPARTLPVRTCETGVVVRQPRRRKHGQIPRIQTPHLFPRHTDGRGGGDVLGTNTATDEQGVETRLV